MLFNGQDGDFQTYYRKIYKACIDKGVNPPDYRFIIPVELYFKEESFYTILENTRQFDYIDTPAQGRWGGFKTHLFVMARNWLVRLFGFFVGYRVPPKYDLKRPVDMTESWHSLVIGLKEDKRSEQDREMR